VTRKWRPEPHPNRPGFWTALSTEDRGWWGEFDYASEAAEAITLKEGRCADCVGLCGVGPNASLRAEGLSGVRFPAEPNEDSAFAWIERCDSCGEYESDEAAAEAHVENGVIEGFAWLAPYGMGTPYPYAVAAITPDQVHGLEEA
jgi:hypothetical protein